MPDVYGSGEFDLAGFIVGIVDRERVLPRPGLRVGDVLVGVPSSGLHTNGYSLARRVLPPETWDRFEPELGRTIGEALLEPHRCYLEEIGALEAAGARAFAHITGGGFAENVARVLPDGLAAEIEVASWRPSAIFRLIERVGKVPSDELYRVFNMGIGLVAVLPPERVEQAQAALPEATVIGRVIERSGGMPVRLSGI
jgi:phosphoribosylformylglycinamidine cyclo-ligase